MPAERKTNQSRGLTAAGLIAVTAATLLMMAWAIFPTAAFASTESTPWDGNGSQFLPCTGTLHWIFTGWGNDFSEVSNPVLHVNGQTYSMSQQGNGNVFEAFVPGPLPPNTDAFATWTWNEAGDRPSPVLTISGCAGTTTTTTTSPPTTTTTTTPTTTTTTPTTTTTTPTTTTTTPTTTTTTPTTTTTTPTTTTTTPGGGGGTTTAPTTTTTTTPIVAPTTVHNTSTTPAAEVLPTTVRPGKLAFTGIEDVVPIGAIALMLMTSGSGLLWAGSRRRRHDGSEDED
jgi:hypothetical protein